MMHTRNVKKQCRADMRSVIRQQCTQTLMVESAVRIQPTSDSAAERNNF
jgi:hypothetical protein